MKFVFKFKGQPLFEGTYDFHDEQDKDGLLRHLRTHLGEVEVMRSFGSTGVRPYDPAEATAWLNAGPASGRPVPPLPDLPRRAPSVQVRIAPAPVQPRTTPGLKPDGTVTVSLMLKSTRLFGHPVCFRNAAEYELYTRLLRKINPNLQVADAGNKPGVPPDLAEWSRWFSQSRHPGWGLATQLLDDVHFELTGLRLPVHRNAASKQAARAKPGRVNTPTTPQPKKAKGPSSAAEKKIRPYFLWAGTRLLHASPVRLSPEEVTRLLALLRHCVHPPETVVRAAPCPQGAGGVSFKRASLYAWCRDKGHFDLPLLARCLELIPPATARPESSTKESTPRPSIPGTFTPSPAPGHKAPVWPGEHPRAYEWATSDRIEFNVFEYK